jgi:4-hydroxybenzoate polyprenyltransferase
MHELSAPRRWWTYQRERFPLAAHGALIAAFSFSTVSFSALLRGQSHVPGAKALGVAFACSFLFFLQLRIADEFKDCDDDARFRPYRPVPRGLVTLRELGGLGLAAAGAQCLLTAWLSPALLPFLALVWAYLALMSTEFFVRSWLKAHPVAYMVSHMLILPLIDLYGTACDWRVAGAPPPAGLLWLAAASLCNGFVLEIGRKIRAPSDEEPGVETYSALWGCRRSAVVWLAVLWTAAGGAWLAARQVRFALPAAGILALVALAATAVAVRYLRRPRTERARWIERVAGLWTMAMYLSMGALPLIVASGY